MLPPDHHCPENFLLTAFKYLGFLATLPSPPKVSFRTKESGLESVSDRTEALQAPQGTGPATQKPPIF